MKLRDIKGVVLLGGFSRRMGEPKGAKILPNGKASAIAIAETLYRVTGRSKVLGIGETQGWTLKSGLIEIIPDIEPYEGPLMGIYTALSSGIAKRYLICSYDQPLITEEMFQRILSTLQPDYPVCYQGLKTGQFYPFPGLYPAKLATNLNLSLNSGNRSVIKWLTTIMIHTIPLNSDEEERVKGFNTTEDWERLWSRFSNVD
ncbi:MAG: molybdenum cofactor guanylyltransferase [bacterium]